MHYCEHIADPQGITLAAGPAPCRVQSRTARVQGAELPGTSISGG